MELSIGKILLILLVVILIFGTTRLPKMGDDLGRAFRSFRKATQEGSEAGDKEEPRQEPRKLE